MCSTITRWQPLSQVIYVKVGGLHIMDSRIHGFQCVLALPYFLFSILLTFYLPVNSHWSLVSGVSASHTVCHNTPTIVERLITAIYFYQCITHIVFASLINHLSCKWFQETQPSGRVLWNISLIWLVLMVLIVLLTVVIWAGSPWQAVAKPSLKLLYLNPYNQILVKGKA